MSKLVPPHGSDSVQPLLVPEADRAQLIEHAKSLPQLPLTTREASDVFMFGMGAYTPLTGFMGKDDWHGVCVDMKLDNGVFWPIPVTLSASSEAADTIAIGDEVALCDGENGEVLAIMTVGEKYEIDKQLECEKVYRTTDPAHPGVQKVLAQESVNLGGTVQVISEGEYPAKYPDLYLRPLESRALFEEKGWSRVAAFQTRNPMHRSHEHLVKIAVEVTDGVFIHQVLGALKPGDIPAEVRTEAIQAMIDNYFVKDTVVQAGYPIEMRYAGPREALFHALIRQNFGCSHLIVGRDHAGVGDYYGPFDAHNIFDELWDGALQTQPLKIDITFYCRKCYGMATGKTCPHDREHHISVSGTEQRQMLENDADIPLEFGRPEVVEILKKYYAGLKS
ncbi:MAG: sulfate adenylyltransferase [Rhizobiaceae bacterium]|nr:sulfate adenylyltransferase [Rhizobiaceae bacterium]